MFLIGWGPPKGGDDLAEEAGGVGGERVWHGEQRTGEQRGGCPPGGREWRLFLKEEEEEVC